MYKYLLCLMALSGITAVSAQTYYYKQTDVVIDGRKTAGDGSGQFITINNKGCYDSDRSGFSVDNGFLRYQNKDGNILIYYGGCFWGDAYYYFTADYSRLNVKPDGGNKVYVYSRTTAPSSVLTSSLIKKKSTVNTGGFATAPVYPVMDGGGTATGMSGTSGTSSTSSRLVDVKCTYCDGSGVNPNPTYSPNYTGKPNTTYCATCRRTIDAHYHDKCPSCNGRRVIQKRQP